MFTKKIDLPRLSYFILKINLSAIEQWLSNQTEIKPISEKEWDGFDTKEYKITILPTEPFTFYHNHVNEFSPSIGGLDFINNDNIRCVEWSWNQLYFKLNVSEPRVPIFAVPIDEILHLLKTGSNLSQQVYGETEVIKLGSEGLFDQVYRDRPMRYSLVYSNALASLTLVCAIADDLVNY